MQVRELRPYSRKAQLSGRDFVANRATELLEACCFLPLLRITLRVRHLRDHVHRGRRMRRRFEKAEVDYLVAEAKLIKDLPPAIVQGNYRVIETSVYRKGDPPILIPALAVVVRVVLPVPGVPAGIPQAALKWFGHRIRGLDRETRHDGPEGLNLRRLGGVSVAPFATREPPAESRALCAKDLFHHEPKRKEPD